MSYRGMTVPVMQDLACGELEREDLGDPDPSGPPRHFLRSEIWDLRSSLPIFGLWSEV